MRCSSFPSAVLLTAPLAFGATATACNATPGQSSATFQDTGDGGREASDGGRDASDSGRGGSDGGRGASDGGAPTLSWRAIPSATWTVGIPAALDLAGYVDGAGTGTSYSLDHLLPDGMTLTGGRINGTPTTPAASMVFHATASSGGSEAASPFFVITVDAAPLGQSRLALASAALSPGQWVLMQQDDPVVAGMLTDPTSNTVIVDWMNKGAYWPGSTPNTGRLAIHASAASIETPWYTIYYEERTDTWSREAGNLPAAHPGHGYDHNCVDPTTGTLYSATYYGNTSIMRLDLATKTWQPNLPAMNLVPEQPTYALVWHEDPAGLVWISGGQGTGKVAFWDKLSGNWSVVATGLTLGEYNNIGAYNPTAGVTVFGGGNSSNLYRVYSSGNTVAVAALDDPPFGPFGIAGGHDTSKALIAPNPNDRTFIFLRGDGSCWQLDAGTSASVNNSWRRCPDPPTPFDSSSDVATQNSFLTPIPNHGVLMLVKWQSATKASVALFKP